jgi:hypothetical protein
MKTLLFQLKFQISANFKLKHVKCSHWANQAHHIDNRRGDFFTKPSFQAHVIELTKMSSCNGIDIPQDILHPTLHSIPAGSKQVLIKSLAATVQLTS